MVPVKQSQVHVLEEDKWFVLCWTRSCSIFIQNTFINRHGSVLGYCLSIRHKALGSIPSTLLGASILLGLVLRTQRFSTPTETAHQ